MIIVSEFSFENYNSKLLNLGDLWLLIPDEHTKWAAAARTAAVADVGKWTPDEYLPLCKEILPQIQQFFETVLFKRMSHA